MSIPDLLVSFFKMLKTKAGRIHLFVYVILFALIYYLSGAESIFYLMLFGASYLASFSLISYIQIHNTIRSYPIKFIITLIVFLIFLCLNLYLGTYKILVYACVISTIAFLAIQIRKKS